MHDVDLGQGRTQGKGVVVVGLRAAHDVVRRRGPFPQYHAHHGEIGLLYGVDQGLAQGEQFGFLGQVAHVDAGGVLQPDDGEVVAAAQGDELGLLDEPLAVVLAAHRRVGALGVGGIAGEDTLAVADEGDRKAVNLGDAGVHLAAVIGAVFQELAVVGEARQDLDGVVGALLVRGEDHVEILGRELGCRGSGDQEHGRIVGRHHPHVILDAVQHAGLRVVHLAKVGGLVEVGLHAAGILRLEVLGAVNERTGRFGVDVPLRVHAADDARPPHRDVGALVRQQDGRADPLVAAAGRVGAVDGVQDRDPQVVQVRMTVERGAAGTPARVDRLLLHELHAGAVGEPDQRDVETLGHVGDHQDVLGLPCDPGARHDLVVEADDDRPFPLDLADAVDDAGAPLLVVLWVVERVQRSPGPGVHQVVEAIVDSHAAALMNLLGGDTRILDPLHLPGEDPLLLLDQIGVFLQAADLGIAKRLADIGHFLEVWAQRSLLT